LIDVSSVHTSSGFVSERRATGKGLKARHSSAQGKVLGYRHREFFPALKGRDESRSTQTQQSQFHTYFIATLVLLKKA
jgi:hypothetical protein